ncbi:MAG: polyprenyl synthetase family protein [Sedimentisphaerales bacterium]
MIESSSQIKAASKQNALKCTFCAFDAIAEELARVNALIEEQLLDCSGTVRELVSHISFSKGKMLRPGLVLLSGRTCGGITDKHILAAAVMEMIHNATLLHDDVIDEGKSRRGLPTLNHLKGNESAILLGDFLLSRVFKMCVELGDGVTEVIADSTARMCEGEMSQTAQRGNWLLSETQYLDIITDKSAVMFSAACQIGAMLAEAGKQQVRMLADFGLNAGIAFQITDDILDLVGSESKTGKKTGNDLDRDKLTLPLIHLLKTASPDDNEFIKRLITRQTTPNSNGALLEKLRAFGSIEYAARHAKKFAKKAISALAGLNESKYKESLIETAKFIAGRMA